MVKFSELKDHYWVNLNIPWNEQLIGFSINSKNIVDAILDCHKSFLPPYCPNIESACPNWSSDTEDISKTNLSTRIGGIMEKKLAKFIPGCCKHPNEKGHPDLIPKELIGIAKNNKSMEKGLEIKTTVNNSWSSHHDQTKELLVFKWTGSPKNVQIIYAIYFTNLNSNDWSTLPPQKGRNTPVCSLLGSSEVKEKGFIVYINGFCYDMIVYKNKKDKELLLPRLRTDWDRNSNNFQIIKG